ncbi:MAG: glutaredoxin family protein [Acidobacteria bacterium]|nr:glutaredoxin family protein [Acidobacteriota bacterium]
MPESVPAPIEAFIAPQEARIALTREVSPAFNRCELTHLEREPIDLALARQQHRGYELRLQEFGCRLERLPAEPDFPDSVFVEDVAVVLDKIAVITRPGATSRRGERSSVARKLETYRPLVHIRAPGLLDGGDVLQVARHLYVGRSSRSNSEGVDQLRELVAPGGYSVTAVELAGCLHLKSAATRVAPETLLINPDWVDAAAFDGVEVLTIDPKEPAAANVLVIDSQALVPAQYTRTRAQLERAGLDVRTVELSELIKAEAGVTCCSLVFRAATASPAFELLTRERCHLCDEMKAVLDAVLPSLGLRYETVDVDRDAALRDRFGDTVPVLRRDGKVVAKVRVDRRQLLRIARRRR